jgi:two-component system cell cycle response regulator
MKIKKPSFLTGLTAVVVALVGLALAAHIAYTTTGFGVPEHERLLGDWVYDFVTTVTALVILGRAIVRPKLRWAWALIGVGTLFWAGSDIYYSLELSPMEEPTFPAPSDATYFIGYAFVLAGIAGLARARVRHMSPTEWADVSIATLGVATIGAAVLVQDVLSSYEGYPTLEIAAAVGYPILDLAILAVAISAISLTGLRPGKGLALLCLGVLFVGIGDAVYTYQTLDGTYVGGLVDSTWVIGAVLMMVAALVPDPETRVTRRAEGWRSFASPVVFSMLVLAFFALSSTQTDTPVLTVLMGMTLLAIVGRLALTFHENRRLVTQLKRDGLTHLGNRSKLMIDLREACDHAEAEPRTLTILDLDGFKSYNDSFGHPAGDAVLVRLGTQLSEAVGNRGGAYRLGGDEFALLIPGDVAATAPVIAAASVALSERGEGFHITSSSGSCEIPREAHEPAVALQLADQRMYEDKDSRRPSPAGEVEAVLVRILQQRAPELGAHGDAVAELASEVAERLGMAKSERAAVSRAAELHDIGKMAIPDAILHKPGPLSDEEWDFMRQHTLLGERILSAASSLRSVGSIVRSSHERWDGKGYPDGLAGEEIPLASRIVFVCDAYDAMVSERPYAKRVPREDALAELRRCAGEMFDPRVVEAFCESAPHLKNAVERTAATLDGHPSESSAGDPEGQQPALPSA